MTVTKEDVLKNLRRIKGPDLESNIVDLNLVSEIVIHGGKVYFSITVDPSRAEELAPLREAAEKLVGEMTGVQSATVTLTSDRKPGEAAQVQERSPQTGNGNLSRPPAGSGSHRVMQPGRGPGPASSGRAMPDQQPQKIGVPGVKHIIAVASGKGGVGKSTTSVNLALALQANGLKTGILDADIYGPSMPRLLGISGRPEPIQGNLLRPMKGYGLNVMSMGFLVEEDTPMIWRGPMVMSALSQMLKEVLWGDLDIMVVDMPPGTGDAQLTMAQQVPLAGAIIVSTPQDLALIDARKGLNMFRRVDVPVLGIIENMSYFTCPHCGERSDIFGHGGAKSEAEKLRIPFLGEIPLHMDIRVRSDAGQPVVVSDPDSEHTTIYRDIARRVWDEIQNNVKGAQPAAPKIVIED